MTDLGKVLSQTQLIYILGQRLTINIKDANIFEAEA